MLARETAPLARPNIAVLVVTCFGAWSANAQADPSPQSLGVSVVSTSGFISRTDSESTLVQSLGISYAVTDAGSVSLRYGAVHHSGGGQPAGTGLGNLVVTGTVTKAIGDYVQLSGGLATTLPTNAIGTGTMEEARFAAEISAIDWFGTMFLPNYLDIAPGTGVSLTVARVTARLQVDVHEVIRVRAERVNAFDAAATALVPDLSLSYRVLSPLSLSAHLTEIRLLTTPSSVQANPSSRTEHFVSVGASIDVKVGGAKTLSGTLTYARPTDGPLAPQRYQAIALDLSLAL
jgi:hypothetical protein